jgi:hypothetical protein
MQILEQLGRVWARATVHHVRDERGDVPGWVMITVMTAALVTAIWLAAEGTLASMVSDALKSVQ